MTSRLWLGELACLWCFSETILIYSKPSRKQDSAIGFAPPENTADKAKDQVIAALRRHLDNLKQTLATKDAELRQKQREIDTLYGKIAERNSQCGMRENNGENQSYFSCRESFNYN